MLPFGIVKTVFFYKPDVLCHGNNSLKALIHMHANIFLHLIIYTAV